MPRWWWTKDSRRRPVIHHVRGFLFRTRWETISIEYIFLRFMKRVGAAGESETKTNINSLGSANFGPAQFLSIKRLRQTGVENKYLIAVCSTFKPSDWVTGWEHYALWPRDKVNTQSDSCCGTSYTLTHVCDVWDRSWTSEFVSLRAERFALHLL